MQTYYVVNGVVYVELIADTLKQAGWDEQALLEFMIEEEENVRVEKETTYH